MMNVRHPPRMHPIRASMGLFAAMQRAWKSSAARLPKPRMKMVAQFQKMALGKGVSDTGSDIWLSKMRCHRRGRRRCRSRHRPTRPGCSTSRLFAQSTPSYSAAVASSGYM